MTDHPPRGWHALIDGREAPAELLDAPMRLVAILMSACERVGASVLKVETQKFEPSGGSVVLVLAESHASVHTYPEHGVYMLDVFTCGDLDALRSLHVLTLA